MPPRCAWTHRRSDRLIELRVQVPTRWGGGRREALLYVLPEHEADLRAYLARLVRYGSRFPVLLLGLCLLAVAAGAAIAPWAGGAVLALVGLLIIVVPVPTPETADALGLRAAVRLVRVLGGLVVVIGVGLIGRG